MMILSIIDAGCFHSESQKMVEQKLVQKMVALRGTLNGLGGKEDDLRVPETGVKCLYTSCPLLLDHIIVRVSSQTADLPLAPGLGGDLPCPIPG